MSLQNGKSITSRPDFEHITKNIIHKYQIDDKKEVVLKFYYNINLMNYSRYGKLFSFSELL